MKGQQFLSVHYQVSSRLFPRVWQCDIFSCHSLPLSELFHARPQRSVEFFCGEYNKNITPYLIILQNDKQLGVGQRNWLMSGDGCTWQRFCWVWLDCNGPVMPFNSRTVCVYGSRDFGDSVPLTNLSFPAVQPAIFCRFFIHHSRCFILLCINSLCEPVRCPAGGEWCYCYGWTAVHFSPSLFIAFRISVLIWLCSSTPWLRRLLQWSYL